LETVLRKVSEYVLVDAAAPFGNLFAFLLMLMPFYDVISDIPFMES